VLDHKDLDERLKLCKVSPEFPRWWEPGKHDKALMQGVAKHGFGRTEYNVLMDHNSVFKEIVEKNATHRNKPYETRRDELRHGDSEFKHESTRGENEKDILSFKPDIEDSDSRHSSDSPHPPSYHALSEDYTQILSSWPKDRAIVNHLEKVCLCV
jgi:hypothetical protein